MELFFAESDSIFKEEVILDEEETRHITKVFRKSIGSKVEVTDGKGKIYLCEIERVVRKNLQCRIISVEHQNKTKPSIIFLIPILKSSERFEFILEKLTELGVDEFLPFYSEHSLIKKGFKIERAKRILISAIKQSRNAYLPLIHLASKFEDVLEKLQYESSIMLFGEPNGDNITQIKLSLNNKFERIILTVGPEGDFSNDEKKLLKDSGFIPVNLFENRLRSETASVVLTVLAKEFLTK